MVWYYHTEKKGKMERKETAFDLEFMQKKTPREGLEPPTYWLTANRSTIELSRNYAQR